MEAMSGGKNLREISERVEFRAFEVLFEEAGRTVVEQQIMRPLMNALHYVRVPHKDEGEEEHRMDDLLIEWTRKRGFANNCGYYKDAAPLEDAVEDDFDARTRASKAKSSVASADAEPADARPDTGGMKSEEEADDKEKTDWQRLTSQIEAMEGMIEKLGGSEQSAEEQRKFQELMERYQKNLSKFNEGMKAIKPYYSQSKDGKLVLNSGKAVPVANGKEVVREDTKKKFK